MTIEQSLTFSSDTSVLFDVRDEMIKAVGVEIRRAVIGSEDEKRLTQYQGQLTDVSDQLTTGITYRQGIEADYQKALLSNAKMDDLLAIEKRLSISRDRCEALAERQAILQQAYRQSWRELDQRLTEAKKEAVKAVEQIINGRLTQAYKDLEQVSDTITTIAQSIEGLRVLGDSGVPGRAAAGILPPNPDQEEESK